MTTLFSAVLARLGLSQSEAAEYLAMSRSSVNAWARGARTIPPGVWTELREYARAVEPVEAMIERAQAE